MANFTKGAKKAAAAKRGHPVRIRVRHISPEDLAYAAGIIDGEGCIFIGEKGGPNPSPHFVLRVQVASVTPALIEWLRRRWEGSVSVSPGRSSEMRDQHRWCISARAAGEFLKVISPYLVIKADQASTAIAFQERKNLRGTGRLSTEEIAIRRTMIADLKQMKKAI